MAPITEKPDHLSVVEAQTLSSARRFELLDELQRDFIGRSAELLEAFYAEAETRLYEYSKQAASNTQEVQFFDSAQELGRKRLPISTDFIYQISNLFVLDKRDRSAKNTLESLAQIDIELAVVEEEDIEVEIASKRMTSAARVQYKDVLYELVQRIDALYPRTEVTEDNNPLDPKAFSMALVSAVQKLYKAPLSCRIILFKSFEQSVLKNLKPFYDQANNLLKEAGILPVLKRKYIKPVNREGPGSRKRNVNAQAGYTQTSASGSEHASFNLTQGCLGSLMSQVRTSLRQGQQNGESNGAVTGTETTLTSTWQKASGEPSQLNFYVYSNNPGPEMAGIELTERLSEEQNVVAMQMPLNTPSNVVPIVVARALANESDQQKPHALSQNNEDVINLVAVFFDKILEDEALPIEIQSLICRLQIPILKVAIKDANFLTNGLHPARQFINDLVSYGLRLDKSRPFDTDAIFKCMVEVVNNINTQYRDDDSVFSSARSDMQEVIAREERRFAIVERRTCIAEEGKVKLELAKTAAKDCINIATENTKISPLLARFFNESWFQVLVMVHLKQGPEAEAWREHHLMVIEIVRVAETYSGSLLPSIVTKDISTIVNSVDQGLGIAFHDAREKEKRLVQFEEALFEKTLSEPGPALVKQEQTPQSVEDDFFADVEVAAPPVESVPPVIVAPTTAVEKHQAQQTKLEGTYIALAETMPEGTWLSYCNVSGNKFMTCKLSKKIDGNLYLFVNRFGSKVHVKTFKQFVHDLQTHEVKALYAAPFFDRVMSVAVDQFSGISD